MSGEAGFQEAVEDRWGLERSRGRELKHKRPDVVQRGVFQNQILLRVCTAEGAGDCS